ncbi:TonB-dependent receptor plug domain-containing protein [Flavobacterium qiangtangense]|uniref:TonB-dependent receptor plug domain-containing protein n=1 Tax=Flavobacterium qiangtangense TaxID=1442595 RepID=A0ABW1PP01_9FLAO
MQIQTKAFLSLSVLFTINTFSQEKVLDTTKATNIEEVVVTGQFEPQSLKKSVHQVRIISKADIQNLAANNLGDVLNQYLNITVRPSGSNGKSTVSMFGLDAQYFKILIDNVPLVNEGGVGNNIDLSQINLNDVEQIEIIEGSMGVTHGANAVSGILNIITKKSSTNKWDINAFVQEETVGKEYALFDEGKHIQGLRVSHSITDEWYAAIGATRTDFKGFLNNRNGKDYTVNDFTRGYSWLPKEQLNTNATIGYKKNGFRAFYRFEFLDENIDFYNSTVQSGYSTALGAFRYSEDMRYLTNRFYHNLNVVGKIFSDMNYNVSISHQKQQRQIEEFNYRIQSDEEYNLDKFKDQSMEVLYSTGTLDVLKTDKINLQLGYEAVNNQGFSLIEGENNTTKIIRERLENYDFFAVSELKFSENFSLRPGVRYSFQSRFDDQYAVSLGARRLLKQGFELRGSIGRSFRTPTFEELFTEMVFSGHNYIGNEDLVPETSMSYEASIKKSTTFDSSAALINTVIVSYMDIKDRIDMALVGLDQGGAQINQYINVSKYNMWNVSSSNQFRLNNWNVNLGVAFVGVSQLIDNGQFKTTDEYLYSVNVNTSISYTLPKWQTVFAAYYKYTGKQQQYVVGESGYILSEIDPYSLLDLTVRKTFFNRQLEATIGARNLFDIKNINQSRVNEGGGHSVDSQLLLAYGTSYFLKLAYNLNF